MNASDLWARRVKKRLEQAGFKVRLLDPTKAVARKKAERLQDIEMIASGKVTPEQMQRRNSLFGGRIKSVRIVEYGGLNRPIGRYKGNSR